MPTPEFNKKNNEPTFTVPKNIDSLFEDVTDEELEEENGEVGKEVKEEEKEKKNLFEEGFDEEEVEKKEKEKKEQAQKDRQKAFEEANRRVNDFLAEDEPEEEKTEEKKAEDLDEERRRNLFRQNAAESEDNINELNKKTKETAKRISNIQENTNKTPTPSPSFDDALKDYTNTFGVNMDKAGIDDFKRSLVESVTKVSPELRQELFDKAFTNSARLEMRNAMSRTAALRKSGKDSLSFPDAADKVDAFLQAKYQFLISSVPELQGLKYPSRGGLQAQEIRDIQMSSFVTLPDAQNRQNERKAIDAHYFSLKEQRMSEISSGLNGFVSEINKDNGVSFSSKGIENYLNGRWKDASGKDLDSQRAQYKAELKEFEEKAFDKLVSKSNANTDFKKQLAQFDKFCSYLEAYSKARGWMEKDEPHATNGDMTPNTIKQKQKKAIGKMPKSTNEKVKDKVDEITGDKAKKELEYNKIKKSIAVSESPNETTKRVNEAKYAFNEKKIKKQQKDQMKSFDETVKNTIDAVPEGEKTGFDNLAVREALGMAQALEEKVVSHGKTWRLFHPFKTKQYLNASKNIIDSLDKKGYTKEIRDHLMHNPEKAENDPVSKDLINKENSINDIEKSNEQILREKNEMSQKLDNLQLGERITVNEADNRQEIINPKERSQFIVPERNRKLMIEGQEKDNKTSEFQQPQDPTNNQGAPSIQ